MAKTEKLSSSLEDYLEAIYLISLEKGAARPTDVAEHLSVANSSTTAALHLLKKRELINHKPYDIITLTPSGKKIAIKIAHKHKILTHFFTKIMAIDDKTSDECACKIEHAIPDKVLERFIEFINFQEKNNNTTWTESSGFIHKTKKN